MVRLVPLVSCGRGKSKRDCKQRSGSVICFPKQASKLKSQAFFPFLSVPFSFFFFFFFFLSFSWWKEKHMIRFFLLHHTFLPRFCLRLFCCLFLFLFLFFAWHARNRRAQIQIEQNGYFRGESQMTKLAILPNFSATVARQRKVKVKKCLCCLFCLFCLFCSLR